MSLSAGDQVKLTPREAPHADGADWWWRVEMIDDHSFVATYLRKNEHRDGSTVVERRWGVSFSSVLAHRKANEL